MKYYILCEIYEDDTLCQPTQAHTNWHAQSGTGLLDLVYLSDEIYYTFQYPNLVAHHEQVVVESLVEPLHGEEAVPAVEGGRRPVGVVLHADGMVQAHHDGRRSALARAVGRGTHRGAPASGSSSIKPAAVPHGGRSGHHLVARQL